jgi:hypothetical protein
MGVVRELDVVYCVFHSINPKDKNVKFFSKLFKEFRRLRIDYRFFNNLYSTKGSQNYRVIVQSFIKKVLLLLLLTLYSCEKKAGVILLIKEGYKGKGVIIFNVPNKDPLRYKNGYYYAFMPLSGCLQTSTSLADFDNRIFLTGYVDKNNTPIIREEISYLNKSETYYKSLGKNKLEVYLSYRYQDSLHYSQDSLNNYL